MYRNDLDAAIARAEHLERELEASRAELDSLRCAEPAPESIERVERVSADDETSDNTEPPPRPAHDFTIALTVIGLSTIGAVVAVSMRSWISLGIIVGLATIWTAFGLHKRKS